MFERLLLAFKIWRLRRHIVHQRRRLAALSMEYFTMESALLRHRIANDESHLKDLEEVDH